MSREAEGTGRGSEEVFRQGEGGRRRSRARSNGTEPYLIARGVYGGAGGATA